MHQKCKYSQNLRRRTKAFAIIPPQFELVDKQHHWKIWKVLFSSYIKIYTRLLLVTIQQLFLDNIFTTYNSVPKYFYVKKKSINNPASMAEIPTKKRYINIKNSVLNLYISYSYPFSLYDLPLTRKKVLRQSIPDETYYYFFISSRVSAVVKISKLDTSGVTFEYYNQHVVVLPKQNAFYCLQEFIHLVESRDHCSELA